jgi:anthranilate phosphoribosyltransferase
MKGESIDEITAAAEVMRELATPVDVDVEPLVDIVGTGGDGASLFNISSASAFVVAAAGGHVAKHGNRGVSSASGSADALEHLGIKLGMPAAMVARGHPRTARGLHVRAGAPRRDAPRDRAAARARHAHAVQHSRAADQPGRRARRLLVGTFSKALCRPMAEVLRSWARAT